MGKRILFITLIFACTSVAWMILGASIYSRTYSSDKQLRGRVASTWGTPHEQVPPSASYHVINRVAVDTVEGGKTVTRNETRTSTHTAPLESSRIEVALRLDHRRKGLLWYSAYAVDFAGVYSYRNPGADHQSVLFMVPLP